MDEARQEIKCILEPGRDAALARWIALHPAAFREAYPERRVNNLYFDSLDLGCFGENLSGVSSRTKCRLRWYGDGVTARRATLEFKGRRNLSGSKRRHEVEFRTELGDLTFEEILRTTALGLPEAERARFDGMVGAVLLNHYRRRYFVSFDGRVRVTVDRDLAFYDQRSRPGPDTRFRVNSPDVIVFECKYASKDDAQTRKAISDLPARVTRCSKYALGVQWILGC
jgi:hypothetical protein